MVCTASRVAMSTSARDRPTGLVGRLGDEDDVDVADVVELACAGLAHADDRESVAADLLAGEQAERRRRRPDTRVRATQRDASSAAPAASARRAATRGDDVDRRRAPGRTPRSGRGAGDSARAGRPTRPRPVAANPSRQPPRPERRAQLASEAGRPPRAARCASSSGWRRIEVRESRRCARAAPTGARQPAGPPWSARTGAASRARSERARERLVGVGRRRPSGREGARMPASASSSASSAPASPSSAEAESGEWVRAWVVRSRSCRRRSSEHLEIGLQLEVRDL